MAYRFSMRAQIGDGIAFEDAKGNAFSLARRSDQAPGRSINYYRLRRYLRTSRGLVVTANCGVLLGARTAISLRNISP